MSFRKASGSFNFTAPTSDRKFKRSLHRKIGGAMVSHSKEAFRYKRWKGPEGPPSWAPRKENYPHPPLKKSRRMFDSIRRRSPDTSRNVRIGTDPRLVYPAVHNYGLRSGRGRGFIMPRRQFMGHSRDLDRRLNRLITRELNKLFN